MIIYLVGGFNHLEKYEFVNGKDDNPHILENKTCSKPPGKFTHKSWPISQICKK